MSAENNVPAIRFEGFSGEWEVLKLGDIATLSSGGTPSRKISKYWNGTIPWITTALLNFNVIKVAEEHITSEGLEDSSAKLLPENTLLMAMYGQGKTRGKIAILGIEAATNQACAAIKLNHEVDNIYIFQSLSSQYRGIRELSNAGGQENLSASLIKEINVSIPLLNEQTKIGQYFQQLDTLITQHQQKHDKLLQLKKSLLEKMFPKQGANEPAIRFKGFSGAWEEKELGSDIADIVGGGTPSTQIKEFWGGSIDWYSPTEIGENVYASKSEKQITQKGLDKSSAKILPAYRTVLFTSRAGIGDMAILGNEGCTNQGFQSFLLKNGYDTYFIYSAGYQIKDFALKHASGSTFLEISGKQLGKMIFKTPDIEEQTKIGNLFKQLDTLITQHHTQLNKLKHIKQACLEKMFV